MGRIDPRVVFGALLVLLGVLLLLQNLNLLPPDIDLLWAFLFLLGGVAFLSLTRCPDGRDGASQSAASHG